MTPKDVIRNTIEMAHQVLTAYVSDMTDADLMVRSTPEANHTAWMLGHMIASEHQMASEAGYLMPTLPDGFVESYTPETCRSDDPARFHKKEQYLTWLSRQRAATLSALESIPEADLDKPSPEVMRSYAPTIGAMFNTIGLHELMHAAQLAPVRRKLGKPIVI
ncbi:MAG: DinB family protein [Phycisphaerae bacterium]|nr:DinB family protein [Phycisphaerae bacterium]